MVLLPFHGDLRIVHHFDVMLMEPKTKNHSGFLLFIGCTGDM